MPPRTGSVRSVRPPPLPPTRDRRAPLAATQRNPQRPTPGWNYDSVLATYLRIEDWHGAADPAYRGTGGPVFVQPAPSPNPLAPATVDGARSVGIPTFENPNGATMETASGAALVDLRIRDGRRESVFRSYVFPYLDQPNLTVLTGAHVNRITFEGGGPAVSKSSTRESPATSGPGAKWCCRSARSTHRRCSCSPASATKRSSSNTEFQCCNIFQVSAGTSRTTSRSTASGNTCRPATPQRHVRGHHVLE